MKAFWRRGFQAKVDANVVSTEFDKIKEANGGVLTATIIHEKIKVKRNPVHKAVEWDDSTAGYLYRLDQIRHMLRCIEIVHPEQSSTVRSRKYEVVTEPAKGNYPERKVYMTTKEILQDPAMRDELLGRAIRDAISYRRKYGILSELAKVIKVIDKFVETQKVV